MLQSSSSGFRAMQGYSTRDVIYLFFSKLQVGNSNSNSKPGCCGLRVGGVKAAEGCAGYVFLWALCEAYLNHVFLCSFWPVCLV